MKLTNINDFTDHIIGKKGTPEREVFEYKLQMDVLSQIIEDARKTRSYLSKH